MEKTAKELKEQLFYKNKNGLLKADEACEKAIADFCEGYKSFLDAAKTEREAVKACIAMAKQAGFEEYVQGREYKAGAKLYLNNRDKAFAAVVVGKNPVEQGVRITAAHIDSPRLDLKPHPLYEDIELALFKTHYYGGIRKYQWAVTPLAIHGVFCKKDGATVNVCIGEDEGDPCFVVNDLLPHLAAEQSKRTLADGIRGEELNVLVGSRPFKDDAESELVKLNILSILFEKYGVTEEDFLSAELECVPAFKARDVGFDRSMVGAYGHDDRACAYTAFKAITEANNPENTLVCVLADKEETGSDGVTGMKSSFLRNLVGSLAAMQGGCGAAALSNSKCLSADVSAAVDPSFQDVSERRNAAYLNHGVSIVKYNGARGKAGSSDASAEYMGFVRSMLDQNGVTWQSAELGKVDAGGGGTVANYVANLGVDTVDIGVPVLSMHAPFETVAKFDVYMTYKAFVAFDK